MTYYERDLAYEEQRQYTIHLMDILKKTTLHLTVAQMLRSLTVVFRVTSPTKTSAFVSSFLNQWRAWMKSKRLQGGEIAYHWK